MAGICRELLASRWALPATAGGLPPALAASTSRPHPALLAALSTLVPGAFTLGELVGERYRALAPPALGVPS